MKSKNVMTSLDETLQMFCIPAPPWIQKGSRAKAEDGPPAFRSLWWKCRPVTSDLRRWSGALLQHERPWRRHLKQSTSSKLPLRDSNPPPTRLRLFEVKSFGMKIIRRTVLLWNQHCGAQQLIILLSHVTALGKTSTLRIRTQKQPKCLESYHPDLSIYRRYPNKKNKTPSRLWRRPSQELSWTLPACSSRWISASVPSLL